MTNKKKDSLFSRIKSKLFSSEEDDDFEDIEDEFDPSEQEDYEARYHGDEEGEDFEAFDDELSDEEREAILRKELGDDYSPVIDENLMAGADITEDEIEEEIDRTDPGFVMSEEVQESEADQVEDDLSFADDESEYADESDDDEILEALESEEAPSEPLDLGEEEEEPLDLGDEEDDEPFEAQPMVISEEDKEDIEDEMEDLDEEFPEIPQEMPVPEPTREIDLAQMESQAQVQSGEFDYEEDEDYYPDEDGEFKEFNVPGQKTGLKGKILGIGASLKGLMARKGKKPSFTPSKPSRFKMPDGFDWDGIYNKIFSVESRPAIHRGFLALLFAVSTYGVGKIAALAIKGTNPQVAATSSKSSTRITYRAKPEMDRVAQTDLFNAPGEILEDPCKKDPLKCKAEQVKPKNEKKVCVKSDKESTLSIKLVNTLVLQDSVKSIAAVQIRNAKDVLNIREGEKIKDIAQIGKIDRQKMIFKNLKTGTCEYIANIDKDLKKMTPLNILPSGSKVDDGKPKNGIKNAGNSYKIPGKLREEMLSNISEVLTQASAIQINNPDGSLSFKITEIVPNSIYAKLDIQNDDIVKTINGKKITNINEVMTLFGNIRQVDHFELGILRNGAEVSKEYDFE